MSTDKLVPLSKELISKDSELFNIRARIRAHRKVILKAKESLALLEKTLNLYRSGEAELLKKILEIEEEMRQLLKSPEPVQDGHLDNVSDYDSRTETETEVKEESDDELRKEIAKEGAKPAAKKVDIDAWIEVLNKLAPEVGRGPWKVPLDDEIPF